jgi:hypothetical protein
MSEKEMTTWGKALKLVPVKWLAEFTRLVEEGDASDEFMKYFEASDDCRRAFDLILRGDLLVSEMVKASADDPDRVNQASSV